MTPIDWNNSNNTRRRSWGRFGEPDESYSPQVHSLKLPKRRGSFDGSDSSHSDDEKTKKPSISSTMCSPTMMLASPSHSSIPRSNSGGNFARQGRLRRRSFRRPSFEIPNIEGSHSVSNSNANANWISYSSSTSNDDHDDDDYLCRKAAQQHFQQHRQPAFEQDDAATMPIRRASTGTRLFEKRTFDDEKPRRGSISGPRPCMESSLAGRDVPLRRRSSFGSIRSCMMENTQCDRPILRPYRQLSSEDLCIDLGCIGEETDEDLKSSRSNRSCLTSVVDFSSRTNRTSAVDFSTRSNRASVVDISTRSNRTNGVTDFSPRSNRSMFRAVGVPEEPTAGIATSLVFEEASHSSASPLPAEPDLALPEHGSWPDKNTTKSMEDNLAFSRNKTWPTNLMVLLSMKQLALKNLRGQGDSSDVEDIATMENHNIQRNKGQSSSPYRNKRRLLRTIDIASDVLDGK